MNAESFLPIYTFWHGPFLSHWEKLCFESFRRQGHKIILFTYNGDLEVPQGVYIEDASQVLPESTIFFYKYGDGAGSIAGFTDLFRLKLLAERGGWWIDTDVICIRPFLTFGKFTVGKEDENRINNAVIYSPVGHPVTSAAFVAAQRLGDEVRWGQGGPALLTRLVCEHDSLCDILPPQSYYPVHWKEAVAMLALPENLEKCEAACKNAQAIHLYNEMFRRAQIPKYMFPPKGSYLHKLFEQHSFHMPPGSVMTDEMVRRLVLFPTHSEQARKYNAAKQNKIIRCLNLFMARLGRPLLFD